MAVRFFAKCCTESYAQRYECQVCRNGISFDVCLFQELNHLWSLGIETIGSCCGHHMNCTIQMGYIQVNPIYEQDMIDLGYERRVNEFGAVLFKPKTKIENIMWGQEYDR